MTEVVFPLSIRAVASLIRLKPKGRMSVMCKPADRQRGCRDQVDSLGQHPIVPREATLCFQPPASLRLHAIHSTGNTVGSPARPLAQSSDAGQSNRRPRISTFACVTPSNGLFYRGISLLAFGLAHISISRSTARLSRNHRNLRNNAIRLLKTANRQSRRATRILGSAARIGENATRIGGSAIRIGSSAIRG